MAGANEIKCIGPSYQLADRKAACQRAVNLYLQTIEGPGEDKPAILVSAPGLAPVLTLPARARGSINVDGRWFIVAGLQLLEVTIADGLLSYLVRGALRIDDGVTPVSMAGGRDQLCIVDGPDGHVYPFGGGTLDRITSDAWQGSLEVDILDGYFIFVVPNTDQFYLSSIDNASSLDALDFSSADVQTDRVVTLRVFRRELYLFGQRSIEVWIDSGGADFPLTRYNITPIDVGIVGRRAVSITSDSLVWVGQTDRGRGYVYEMRGHQPVRVSTQAVEEALNAAGVDLGSTVTWSYHVEGNEFVGINADGMSATWVFDLSTRQWHERAELIDGAYAPMRGEFVTFFQGAHYALAGSAVYRMDRATYDVAGQPLPRERTWPHLLKGSMEPITFRGLELACTSGHGGLVTLEVSNDGGYRWGPPLARELGVTGRDMQRIRWLMLGAARDRVFRIRCADPVPLSLHAAAVEAA